LFPLSCQVLAAAFVVALAAGCGERPVELAPVSGKIRYRGEPLRSGSIVFTPDPDRGGRGPLAHADIQPDGTYRLFTGDQPGAVAGWHRITLLAVEPSRPGGPPSATAVRFLLPLRYSDPEQSGLLREVKAGEENVLDFDLE
jgi:hypothetical protein